MAPLQNVEFENSVKCGVFAREGMASGINQIPTGLNGESNVLTITSPSHRPRKCRNSWSFWPRTATWRRVATKMKITWHSFAVSRVRHFHVAVCEFVIALRTPYRVGQNVT